jgi:hypothetical protein
MMRLALEYFFMQHILNNHHCYIKRIFIVYFLVFSSGITIAQTPMEFKKAAQIYSQIVRGERKFETLSPSEKQQVLSVQHLFSNSCGNLYGKCNVVCEAANELKNAADDLSSCANRHDYSEDCLSHYRETKDKFEQYESAVSDASGDCS